MPNLTKAFNENISILVEELRLADNWGKASIIFTIHKDIFSHAKTKQVLSKRMGNSAYRFVEVETDKVDGNLIEYLVHFQDLEHTVFYISNIDWGGGEDHKDFYRILNLHRETFIENKMKLIFFLTLTEASKLPHFSPDFWAFRHLVLEFATSSARTKKKPPAGIMLWQLGHSVPGDIYQKRKISDLKKIIDEIPDQPESMELRIDMQFELGYLSWQKGDLAEAEKTLKAGLELAKIHNLTQAQPKLINGLAILAYERGDYLHAIELLEPVINEHPHDCLLLMNQAISMFALNQRRIGIKRALKTKTICAQNAWIEFSLGFLYYFAGKIDEAASCFQKAVDISPNTVDFHTALIICYLAMDLRLKANDQLVRIKKGLLDKEIIYEVLKTCIAKKGNDALTHIEVALGKGELSINDIVRDPILYALVASQEASIM